MKKCLLYLTLCFYLAAIPGITSQAQGQPVTIQGKITDKDNKPIHGVTIAEVDEEGRTIKADRTDVDGNFSLKIVNKKHKLNISHISFKTVEVPIGERTIFNQSLESSTKDLGDVTIISQRKADNGMVAISERNHRGIRVQACKYESGVHLLLMGLLIH